METPGIPSTRWFDATLLPEGPGFPAGQRQGHVHHGTWRQHDHAYAGGGPGDREARAPGRVRSLSHDLGGALGAQERHLLAAGVHQFRDGRLTHRLQSLAPMGRADREADLRVQERLRRNVHARAQARLRGADVQEHQSRERRSVGRGHLARDQSRRLVDRLLRPVARAAQAAHGESVKFDVDTLRAPKDDPRSGGTITVCRGRAGARRNSSTPARRCSTTPICR